MKKALFLCLFLSVISCYPQVHQNKPDSLSSKAEKLNDQLNHSGYYDHCRLGKNIFTNSKDSENLRRIIVGIGLNGVIPIVSDYRYAFTDYYYYYHHYYYKENVFLKETSGISINLDLLFPSKKSLPKRTLYGFAVSLQGGIYSNGSIIHKAGKTASFYYEDTYYGVSYISAFLRVMPGIGGITTINKTLSFDWNIKPINAEFAFLHYSLYDIALGGAVDLGLGIRIFEKCIIEPNIRFWFDYLGNRGILHYLELQAGVTFKFLNHKKTRN